MKTKVDWKPASLWTCGRSRRLLWSWACSLARPGRILILLPLYFAFFVNTLWNKIPVAQDLLQIQLTIGQSSSRDPEGGSFQHEQCDNSYKRMSTKGGDSLATPNPSPKPFKKREFIMSQSFTTASCRDLSYVKAEFLSWAVREVLEEGQESGASRPLFALLGGVLGY